MKQFNLTSFLEVRGEYHIWFGNNRGVSFANKRYARNFLANTNRILTKHMIELNELYITAFGQYRFLWFTLLNFKNGYVVNESLMEKEMQKIIYDITDQFNRAGNSGIGSSSGAYSFMHLLNICTQLKALTSRMVDINKKRSQTINWHIQEILIERLTAIENQLLNYPDKLPQDAIKILGNNS